MEYVDSRSLQDIFQSHARARTWLDPEEALDYFKQLLDGLSFAHSHAIVEHPRPQGRCCQAPRFRPSEDHGGSGSGRGARRPHLARCQNGHFGLHVSGGGQRNDFGPPYGYLLRRIDRIHFIHGPTSYSRADIRSITPRGRKFTVYDLIREAAFDCDPMGNSHIKFSESACKLINSMLYKDREQHCQCVRRVLQELTRDAGKACSQCGASNRSSGSYCDQCGQSLSLPVVRSSAAGPAMSAQDLTDEGFALAREES
jgi:hypothetical protein